jgi:hypothetical protein
MNESTVVDAFGKLGAAALLGVLLYVVLVRVGERVIRAIDKLADNVAANTAATLRVEAKLDQAAADRARYRPSGRLVVPAGMDDTDDEGRR